MTGILNVMMASAGGGYPFEITAGYNSGYGTGYQYSPAIGTLVSGGTFKGGSALYQCIDTPGETAFDFQISGLGADPGQDSLLSIYINGKTYTGAGAASYVYGSGTATWSWNTAVGFSSGTNYSGNIQTNGAW